MSARRFDLPLESTAASRFLSWIVGALLYLAVVALAVAAGRWATIRGWPPLSTAILIIDLWVLTWALGRILGYGPRVRARRRLLGYRLSELDELSGRTFERWVAARLAAAGIRTEELPPRGDFGVDLIARISGERVAIEIKRRSGAVGNDVVRSVVAGARFHGCELAAVVTQSRFTREAHRQAAGADLPVRLLARDELGQLSERLQAFVSEATRSRRAADRGSRSGSPRFRAREREESEPQ